MEADFNRFGTQAIALVREKKPEVYIKVVADLLPKEANINVEAGEAFLELWRKISDGLGNESVDHLDERIRLWWCTNERALAALLAQEQE